MVVTISDGNTFGTPVRGRKMMESAGEPINHLIDLIVKFNDNRSRGEETLNDRQ